MKKILVLVGFLAAVLAAARSEAGVLTFTDRAAWEAASGSPNVNVDFESSVADVDFFGTPNVDLGPLSIQTYFTIGPAFSFIDVPAFSSPQSVGNGTPHAFFSLIRDSFMYVDFFFDDYVSAVGFDFMSDAGAGAFGGFLADFYAGPSFTPLTNQVFQPSSTGFFGIRTTAGEQISVIRLRTDNCPGCTAAVNIDNIVGVVQRDPDPSVPEPASLSLLLAGAAMALGRRRAQRRG